MATPDDASSSDDNEELFDLRPDLLSIDNDGRAPRQGPRSLSKSNTPTQRAVSNVGSRRSLSKTNTPEAEPSSATGTRSPAAPGDGGDPASLTGFRLRERLRAKFLQARSFSRQKASEIVSSAKERLPNVDRISRLLTRALTKDEGLGSGVEHGVELAAMAVSDAGPAGPISSLPDDLLLECLARVDRASIGAAAGVCRFWRALVRCSAYSEYREALGLLDSHVLVFSQSPRGPGELLVQCFRPRSNAWAWAFVPAATAIDDESRGASLGRRALLFSGVLAKGAPPCVYDPWTHSMAPAPQLATPRLGFVCGHWKGAVFVAGGKRSAAGEAGGEGGSRDLQSAETLRVLEGGGEGPMDEATPAQGKDCEAESKSGGDEQGARWTSLPDMHKVRYNAVGCCIAGRFYVVGGTRSNQQFRADAELLSLEVFHRRSATWELRQPVPRLGVVLGAAEVGRKLFVLRRTDTGRVAWTWYDTAEATWHEAHEMAGMPADPQVFGSIRFACVSLRGRVLVLQVRGTYDDINPRGAAHGGAHGHGGRGGGRGRPQAAAAGGAEDRPAGREGPGDGGPRQPGAGGARAEGAGPPGGRERAGAGDREERPVRAQAAGGPGRGERGGRGGAAERAEGGHRGPQGRPRPRTGPLVLQYNPDCEEGAQAWRRLPDMPVATPGAVCVVVRC